MKKIQFAVLLASVVLLCSVICGCRNTVNDHSLDEKQINKTLDELNHAAAMADFNQYFNLFTPEAVFLGTDATEHWSKNDFMAYAKPHFDNGKGWTFTSLKRNIYFDSTGKVAWFD